MLLQVDDSGARYPIAIDPLTQSAEIEAADGGAGDSFGAAVAAADGTLVVGAPDHEVGAQAAAGAAYVFSDASGSWQQTAELSAPDGEAGDSFGAAVAVTDGTIVVGAPDHKVGTNSLAGAVYVFSDATGSWEQTIELNASDPAGGDSFGTAVAVADGTIVVGAPDHEVGTNSQAGAAYVFSDASGSWQQTAELSASDGAAGDLFGTAVTGSGSAIVVGAPDHEVRSSAQAGAAYVFSDRAGRWQQTTELAAGDGATGDRFGTSVALSGSVVVAGAPGHAPAGAAYAFDDDSGTWQQAAELAAGDGVPGDSFGACVAIFGSTIVAGAPDHTVVSDAAAGAAYVFSYASGGWQQSGEQTAADAAANDAFGTSVAVSAGAVLAGAPAHTVGNNSGQGAAYLYALPVAVGAPASTAPPLISGTAVEADTLTESPASWTDNPTSIGYQWEDCDASGSVCSPILGATGQTYTLTGADVGQTIVVQETAANADGAGAPASSSATSQVAEGVPVSTSSPSITGAAFEGATLTESNGSWTNNPVSYSYQWEDCDDTQSVCTPIVGATGQTYQLTAGDVGETIVVQETATNATGTGSPANSAATAVVVEGVPVSTSSPSISGNAVEGATLTESPGSWTNSPVSYTYQWEDCSAGNCEPISNADGQKYKLAATDVGQNIVVQETAWNGAGAGSPANSAATAVVVEGVPVSTSPPSISGDAVEGSTLTESNGSWTNNPASYSYQWEDCAGSVCSPIAGATGQTYVLTAGDVGATIVVQETATDATGAGSPASSAATTVVSVGVPVSTSPPSLSGDAVVGSKLTESHGSWTNNPASYSYQWEDCAGSVCSPIAGATGQTYVLNAGDVGATIVVQETATDATGAGSPASSAATAVVVEGVPVSTSPPSISGDAVEGSTLTESNGSWTNNPASYSYQWEDCAGSVCSPIAGATGQTYVLTAGDVGATIVVQETATDATGAGSPASSAATTVVSVGVPVSTSPPSLSGDAVVGSKLTESHGSWTNNPASYSYQWEDCAGSVCSPIAGATGQTYVLTAGDVGATIVVQETATDATGAGSPASSAATTVVGVPVGVGVGVGVPLNTSPPLLSGDAVVGSTLTESHGSWTNNPASYSYQWEDCEAGGCSPIAGATGQTYVVAAGDVGATIVVQETATDATGAGSPASSAASGVVGVGVGVGAGVGVPVSTSAPSVSGDAVVGSTLTESHGSWANNPVSYSYQWEDCEAAGCSPIAGANGQTYVLGTSDVGHTIEVQETATNATGAGSPASSAATAVVGESAAGSPPPPAAVSAAAVSTSGTNAVLKIACAGGAGQRCAGAVIVSAWVRTQSGAVVSVLAGRGTQPRGYVAVVVASASFLVEPQHQAALQIGLNTVGKRLLAGFYRLPTIVAIRGTNTLIRTVTFAYARVQARVKYFYAYTEYTRYYRTSSTNLLRLEVTQLPAEAHVVVNCDGAGCPLATRVVQSRSQELVLNDPFGNSALSPGATVEIVITAPESIGKVLVLEIRGGASPTLQERCLPPGYKKPVTCAR